MIVWLRLSTFHIVTSRTCKGSAYYIVCTILTQGGEPKDGIMHVVDHWFLIWQDFCIITEPDLLTLLAFVHILTTSWVYIVRKTYTLIQFMNSVHVHDMYCSGGCGELWVEGAHSLHRKHISSHHLSCVINSYQAIPWFAQLHSELA